MRSEMSRPYEWECYVDVLGAYNHNMLQTLSPHSAQRDGKS